MHFINTKCVWLLDKNWVLSLQAANPHVCECVRERGRHTWRQRSRSCPLPPAVHHCHPGEKVIEEILSEQWPLTAFRVHRRCTRQPEVVWRHLFNIPSDIMNAGASRKDNAKQHIKQKKVFFFFRFNSLKLLLSCVAQPGKCFHPFLTHKSSEPQ